MKKTWQIVILLLITGLTMAQTPESFLKLGQQKAESGDLDAAESLFQQAINLDPTFAPALFGLAKVYLRKGDMKQTQEFLLKAIEVEPENQEYRKEYERMDEINNLMNDGNRAMKNGQYKEAYESYRVVLEKFPFFADAAYSMGLALFRQGEYDSAVVEFHKALELNPYHENARAALTNVAKKAFNEGNNAYRRGDLEGALAAYRKVLEIDDRFYQAQYQIGVIEAKRGDLDKAMSAYQKALKINPNFYKGWFALGLAKNKSGDYEGALEAFKKSIDTNPGYVKAYVSMGDIYNEQKDYDKAVEVLKTAIQVNPSYAKSYISLAYAYTEMEKFKEAAENLEKATQLNPKNSTAWFLLAQAHNELGNCEEAKRAAYEATDRKKNFGGGWYELGVAEWCNGKGNKTAALNALERARNDRTWRKNAEYMMDKIKNPHKYSD